MGCAQSKVDNEESVARCKERKILMKEAVAARNAFAAGHSGYAVSLKNIGAALSDYAHGEAEDSHIQAALLDATSQPPPPPLPPPPHSLENLPPPPPPLPNFSPSPIKRAMSMPAMPMKQLKKAGQEMDSIAIEEAEEEEEEEERGLDHGARNGNKNNSKDDLSGPRGPHNGKVGPEEGIPRSPPRTPENHSVPPMPEAKNVAWDYFFMVENMPSASLEAEDDHNHHLNHDHRNTNGKDSTCEIPGGGELDEVEPRTPEKVEEEKVGATIAEEEEEKEDKKGKQFEHSKTAPAEFMLVSGKKGVSVPSVNLMQVLNEIDDNFLKASESAQEVSRMLEATRLHYHSSFADNRGFKFNNS